MNSLNYLEKDVENSKENIKSSTNIDDIPDELADISNYECINNAKVNH